MKTNTWIFAAVLLAPTLWVEAVSADVVVVVSAKSPVASLTKDQVSDLFLGKASTFPGGKQAIPINLSEGSDQRDAFHRKVTGRSANQLRAYWSRMVFSGRATPPKEVPNVTEAKRLIAANPSTIGYIDKAAVDGSVKVVLQ